MNLSRPDDYFGAERFFGENGGDDGEDGLHVILHPEDTSEEIMQVEMNVETNIQTSCPPDSKKRCSTSFSLALSNIIDDNRGNQSTLCTTPCWFTSAG